MSTSSPPTPSPAAPVLDAAWSPGLEKQGLGKARSIHALSGPVGAELLGAALGQGFAVSQRFLGCWNLGGGGQWGSSSGFVVFFSMLWYVKNPKNPNQTKAAALRELLKGLRHFHKPHTSELLSSISHLKG